MTDVGNREYNCRWKRKIRYYFRQCASILCVDN